VAQERSGGWDAGGVLMRTAHPADWRELAASWALAQANADELKVCREMAARAGKAQSCIITVAAP